MKAKRQIVTGLLWALCSSAYAFEAPSLEGPWSATVELGSIANSGNSRSTSVNAKFNLGYETKKWKDTARFDFQYGTKEGDRTEERYNLLGESRYFYSGKMFLFGRAEVQRQHFKAFDLVISEAIGVGRNLIKNDEFLVDVQIGPGGRHSRDDGKESMESEPIIETGAGFKWFISKGATLSEELSTKTGADNTFARSETALTSKLVGRLALKLSYVAEFNSNLPDREPNKSSPKHVDTTTSITMVYDFN